MSNEKKYIYGISGAILFIFLLLYGKNILSILPYFKIKNIEIEGNRVLSKQDILKILNVSSKDSIFFFDENKAVKKFMNTGIVKSVKIFTIYPNTLKILLHERYPIACAKVIRKNKTRYYLIDDEGSIIRRCESKYPGLPVIVMDYSKVADIERFKNNVKNTLYSLSVIYFNNKKSFKRIKQIELEPNRDKVKIWIDDMSIKFMVKDFLKVRDFLEMKFLVKNRKVLQKRFSKIDLRFDDIIAK